MVKHHLSFAWCARRDLNPHGCPPGPKPDASANSATRAQMQLLDYTIFSHIAIDNVGNPRTHFDKLVCYNAFMDTKHPKVICVSGLKNSGKTALVEALIPLLAEKGVRTAVVKHHGHGFGDEIPDKPGTDTYRFLASGAHGTVIYDEHMFALVKREQASLESLVAMFSDANLVLVEGAKGAPYPHIAMLRSGQPVIVAPASPTVCDGERPAAPTLCAITDPGYDKAALPDGLPRFDFGDFAPVADIILEFLNSRR